LELIVPCGSFLSESLLIPNLKTNTKKMKIESDDDKN
jgi:hypothetical protein